MEQEYYPKGEEELSEGEEIPELIEESEEEELIKPETEEESEALELSMLDSDILYNICESMDDRTLEKMMLSNKRIQDVCSGIMQRRKKQYFGQFAPAEASQIKGYKLGSHFYIIGYQGHRIYGRDCNSYSKYQLIEILGSIGVISSVNLRQLSKAELCRLVERTFIRHGLMIDPPPGAWERYYRRQRAIKTSKGKGELDIIHPISFFGRQSRI